PFCGNEDTKVIDSRPAEEGSVIRRRRECKVCRSRFTTFERFEVVGLTVVKSNQDKEPYDREKMLSGLRKAFEKRPFTKQRIEDLATEIENELRSTGEQELRSAVIGALVLRKLKELDEIAYLRFASVYKNFQDVTEFQEELGLLLEKK
ncbi:MAG: transcriptional regulator NrdR, partial [Candidatus Geothermincolia bacterium]